MKKAYYGVKIGKVPGIYNTWKECEAQVRGFSGAVYKKFSTYNEAYNFIKDSHVQTNFSNKDKEKVGNKEEENLIEREDLHEGQAIAYVDGSFDLSSFTFSYGVVFITKEDKKDYSGRDDNETLAKMRNVSGEIKGAMVAMDIAIEENMNTLYLHFDYMGIEKWAKGEWKANKDGTKFYKEYYDSIKDKLNVVFVKVKAHSGVKYNEEADRLAKEAIILK